MNLRPLPPELGYALNGVTPLYLNTREAAEMVGLSPRTLEYDRTNREGPTYFKMGGRVRYAVANIERWVRTRRQYRTRGSERAGPRRAKARREAVNAS